MNYERKVAGKRPLERVVLEISLKPFRSTEAETIADVWRQVFRQWAPLTKMAEKVGVLFWTGAGQEIFTWRGRLDDEIEWARYVGFCNADKGLYPGRSAQAQPRELYVDAPIRITYGVLRTIVSTLRRVAEEEFGLDVEVGATVDPGPEFAEDEFRYEKHREIVAGGPEGKPWPTVAFINCWARLHADKEEYAGFPNGIPEGASFGTVLGRQTASFLRAMGFDYIWFSNGLGFSHYPWWLVGVNFDGLRFGTTDYGDTAQRLLGFWKDFARECPGYPVEVRGHNFPDGVGIAAHCVRLKDIYATGVVRTPAPNPPWGSRDLGMEIAAHMSHLAHPPGDDFVCRFYINDPWFYTNPWWDYYNREPFDIYAPLAVSRVNERGEVENPSHLELLTIDTERGELREDTAIEVIPHIRRAVQTAPDEPGLLTWVYPFDEYDEVSRRAPEHIGRAFFYDLFLREAIQTGLPLNTVMSSADFCRVLTERPAALARTIVAAPTPMPHCHYEQPLADFVASGGRALLYGPLDFASANLLSLLGLAVAEPVAGELQVDARLEGDELGTPNRPKRLIHRPVVSAGGVSAVQAGPARVLARVRSGGDERVYASSRAEQAWNGGVIAWIRGTVPLKFDGVSATPHPDSPSESVSTAEWMRSLLRVFGYEFVQVRHDADARPVVQLVYRHRNALMITGHKPDATVFVEWRFPDGAPILTERETRVQNGRARYYLARSFHEECRVLVDQQTDTLIACKEQQHPTGAERRLLITGLVDAKVVVLPPHEQLESGRVQAVCNGKPAPFEADRERARLRIDGVSGSLTITW